MILTDTEREIIIEALSKEGLPIFHKEKKTQEDKMKYRKIEEIHTQTGIWQMNILKSIILNTDDGDMEVSTPIVRS